MSPWMLLADWARPEPCPRVVVAAIEGAGGTEPRLARRGCLCAARPWRTQATSHGLGQPHSTEEQVVALVAKGLTNQQIAQQLFISRATIKTHLEHIFTKVDIHTRTHLAAEATRRTTSRPDGQANRTGPPDTPPETRTPPDDGRVGRSERGVNVRFRRRRPQQQPAARSAHRDTLPSVQLELRPMNATSIAEFLEHSRSSYVADLVVSGVGAAEAERLGADQQAAAFPNGQPADGHLVMEVIADTEVCGHLWIGPRAVGDAEHWWVWDIEIAEAFRGRGLGRWAMELAEDCARQLGANEIGLTVFVDNMAARRLYDGLGYREASLRLGKAL